MNKIIVAVLVILVILGGVGVYLYKIRSAALINTTSSPTPLIAIDTPVETSEIIESSSSGDDTLLAGGSSYLDSSGVFSFLYPNDYKLDEQDKAHIRIYKTGPTQKGQTEMYDGALVVFEVVTLKDESLEEWVDNYIKTSTADGTSSVIEAKKSFSINNYPGFTFQIKGLGESKYYVLQKDTKSKNVVMMVSAVYDPTSVGFQKQVDGVLENLKILK